MLQALVDCLEIEREENKEQNELLKEQNRLLAQKLNKSKDGHSSVVTAGECEPKEVQAPMEKPKSQSMMVVPPLTGTLPLIGTDEILGSEYGHKEKEDLIYTRDFIT